MTANTTTNNVQFIITDNNITVSIDGRTHMVARSDANAPKLIDALRNKRYDEVPELISIATKIEKYTDGNFKVEDGCVMVDGVEVNGLLASKIMEFEEQGLPYMPLVRFARNVRKNPSERAINDLYAFLQHNGHPITDDGCFVAYKRVRKNFKDIHTGTMDNSVGKTVSMPRAEVDDDPERTCSRGLHVASFDYAHNHFGGSGDVMLEVKVSPDLVVAIPVDYNSSKIRTAGYTVLSVIDKPLECSYRNTDTVHPDKDGCVECGGALDEDSVCHADDCEFAVD
jgi:hypothetical protein